MPCFSIPLSDIEQAVSRPTIFAVVKEIIEITGIPNTTEIFYAGKRLSLQNPGSSVDDKAEVDRDIRLSTNRYVFIDVEESYDRKAVQETRVHEFDEPPVFLDHRLKFAVTPIYIPSDVTLSLRYQSPSETEANRWYSDMYVKVSRGRDVSLHSTRYTYPLPGAVFALIDTIYTLRESKDPLNEPYGEPFQEYVRRHGSNRLTFLSNRAGEHVILGVRETQAQIQGYFDLEVVPERPSKKEDNTWEVSFTYRFSYQRPEAVSLRYPITVHSQYLPEKYLINIREAPDPGVHGKYLSQSMDALSLFDATLDENLTRPVETYLRYPDFDDFQLNHVLPGSATSFVFLCVPGDDKRSLLDLKGLGDFTLDERILPFFKSEAAFMTRPYWSFFHIAVYRGDAPMDDAKIVVTPDLEVKSLVALSTREVYHVRLSLIIDIKLLTQDAFNRLSKFPKEAVYLLGELNALLAIDPEFQRLAAKPKLESWDLSPIYQYFLRGGIPANLEDVRYWGPGRGPMFFSKIGKKILDDYLAKRTIGRMTKMYGGIIARRKENT